MLLKMKSPKPSFLFSVPNIDCHISTGITFFMGLLAESFGTVLGATNTLLHFSSWLQPVRCWVPAT